MSQRISKGVNMDIGGIHKVAQAPVPMGIMSGRATKLLQDEFIYCETCGHRLWKRKPYYEMDVQLGLRYPHPIQPERKQEPVKITAKTCGRCASQVYALFRYGIRQLSRQKQRIRERD